MEVYTTFSSTAVYGAWYTTKIYSAGEHPYVMLTRTKPSRSQIHQLRKLTSETARVRKMYKKVNPLYKVRTRPLLIVEQNQLDYATMRFRSELLRMKSVLAKEQSTTKINQPSTN